jgi:hypothetical protein
MSGTAYDASLVIPPFNPNKRRSTGANSTATSSTSLETVLVLQLEVRSLLRRHRLRRRVQKALLHLGDSRIRTMRAS